MCSVWYIILFALYIYVVVEVVVVVLVESRRLTLALFCNDIF